MSIGIDGVKLIKLKVFGDSRGSFYEAFRASWVDDRRRWVQWNVSTSVANVVRGLHFHKLQTDYWLVPTGKVQVALVDLRSGSPTQRTARCVMLEGGDPHGLCIPPGVLHGYRILETATVMYLVDVEYNGQDEYGVRWDDPALGLPAHWYQGAEPTLSPRDAAAPMLADLKTAPVDHAESSKRG
jgi:dTDP-4-dehydrorhamnose 3,5-epimerase